MRLEPRTVGFGVVAVLLLVLAFLRTRHDPERGRPDEVASKRVELDATPPAVPQVAGDSARSEPRNEDSNGAPRVGAGALVVEVRDAYGLGIADAEVTFAALGAEGASVASKAEPRGVTTRDGALRIAAAPTVAGEWRATRAGYAPSTRAWRPGESALIELVLTPARDIRGRVVYAGGEVVRDPVTVAAWPARATPSSATWREVRAGRSSAACKLTTTAPDGQFLLEGLESPHAYALVALDDSALSLAPVIVLTDSHEAVQLELHSVYSVRVVVRAAGGAAIRSSPRLFGDGPSWSLSAEARASSLLALPPWAQALSTAADGDPDPPTPLSGQLYFSTTTPRSWLSGIDYTVTVPGYEPITAELTAAPLGADAVPIELEATPVQSCWGTLQVVVRRPQGAQPRVLGLHRNLGTLHLRDDRGANYNLQVRQTLDGVEDLHGVPCGRYSARFRSTSTHFEHPQRDQPPMLVVVEPGPRASPVHVDLERVATFELELVDDTGAPYLDWVGVELIGVSPLVEGLRAQFSFKGPSYLIDAVLPGDYVVQLTDLPACDVAADSRVLLPAVSGEVVRATLTAACHP